MRIAMALVVCLEGDVEEMDLIWEKLYLSVP